MTISQLTLADAIDGYSLAAEITLAPTTCQNYAGTFCLFQAFFEDDPLLDDLTERDIERFLADLKKVKNEGKKQVSDATIRTRHIHLAALWTWLIEQGYATKHIVQAVKAPKPKSPDIVPYTQADVVAMLGVLNKSRRYSRPGKRETEHSLPHPLRNRTIILVLLDTGLRATELCNLQIRHVDIRNSHIQVEGGKGDKDRNVPFSTRTGQILWQYITSRKKDPANAPLFINDENRPLDRHSLRKTLIRIGERAGLRNIGVHRFRHTFAVNFLRNGIKNGGANPWALQQILGHTDMQTVSIYLKLAQADLDTAHRTASVVENWRL
ncbi:MAG: tyrosine-type recombinase/integrase [Anaerolineales bacterium]|nr:tyrosine-type recombinase/integrase [Anaerolineales bacterium]